MKKQYDECSCQKGTWWRLGFEMLGFSILLERQKACAD